MREYKCDVCKSVVGKFNGSVTITVYGQTLVGDACSSKCLVASLRSFALDLEKKAEQVREDNAAFAKEHPEAKSVPAPAPAPEPALPSGCAACNQGIPVTRETAYRHTGDGVACRKLKSGPCDCPPSNWKSVPADSSTPGPREVSCQKCGLCWTAMVVDPEIAHSPATPAKRGRRKKENGAVSAPPAPVAKVSPEEAKTLDEKLDDLRQQRENAPPAPKPSAEDRTKALFGDEGDGAKPKRPLNRDMSVQEPPRWCGCGSPLQWTGEKWMCSGDPIHDLASLLAVREGLPGENLSRLAQQVETRGLRVDLKDLSGWTVLRRDMLRLWVDGGAMPEFVEQMLAAQNAPARPPVPVQTTTPKFQF